MERAITAPYKTHDFWQALCSLVPSPNLLRMSLVASSSWWWEPPVSQDTWPSHSWMAGKCKGHNCHHRAGERSWQIELWGTNCSWQPHTRLVDPIARAASGSALNPFPQVTNDQPCQTSTTWVPCMTVRRCSSLAGLMWLTSLWQHQMRYCSDENSFVQKGIQDEALCAGNLGSTSWAFSFESNTLLGERQGYHHVLYTDMLYQEKKS